jgi:branched-chain amino acid transport system substrate-binding protein
VAIIYADDPFSREVAADSRAFAPRLGMQVVAYRMYPSGATDLRAVLKSVMRAGPGGAVPDMLLGSGHLVESVAAMRAARALGTNPKLYAFTVGPGTAGFLGALGRDANDVISSVQWTADQGTQGIDVFGTAASYARIYRSVYGSAPPYQAAEASAAGLAYQYAIERAGSIDPARVRSSLATLNVQTFAGPLRFDARGANVYKGMATIQIQNGRAVTVYPQAATGARLVYPTPPFGSR